MDSPKLLSSDTRLISRDPAFGHFDMTSAEFADAYSRVVPHATYFVDYWRMILKYKWTIIACTVVVATLAAIVSFRMTPVYMASGQLAIYRESSDSLGLSGGKGIGDSWDDWDSNIDLDTQVKVLQSDALAMQVINTLHLDANAAFAGPQAAQARQERNSPVPRTDDARDTALLSRFHGALKVSIVPRTRVVELRFTSTDPKLAAEVVNTVANAYIDQNFKTKFEATTRTSEWLSRQLADLQVKVEASQEKLVRYQKEHGILGLDEKQNIITSKLDQLNKELTLTETDRIQKEASYRLAASGDPQYLTRERNALLERLHGQLSDLTTQYAALNTQYGPSYPKVQEINNQIHQTELAIQAEIHSIGRKVKADYDTALQREKMLRAALDQQKQQANQLNESAIEYNILKRDVETNRQLYEGLLQKLKEAGISAGLRSSNVRIVDAARVPVAPAKPDIPRNILMGLLVGLTGGFVLAFVRETLDNSVRTPEQVEVIANLPTLGIIPLSAMAGSHRGRQLALPANTHPVSKVEIVAHSRPKSDMAESYRALRTAILLSCPGGPPKVLLVTSALPKEGKTTTSINTAIVLAQRGSRVLLIDADLRRPSIHRAMGISSARGLSTMLSRDAGAAEYITAAPGVPNLSVLPAGPLPPQPAELLGSAAFQQYLTLWRTQFDHIVIDTPPVLSVTDAVLLSVVADRVLLVIRSDQTTKHALRRSRELLLRVNANVLGVVVNAVNVHAPDAYYYYYYGSKHGGKYYEQNASSS